MRQSSGRDHAVVDFVLGKARSLQDRAVTAQFLVAEVYGGYLGQ